MILKAHPAVGLTGEYLRKGETVKATVVAVRTAAGFIFNRKTMEAKDASFIEVKLQPEDGSRAFWSKPMVWAKRKGKRR